MASLDVLRQAYQNRSLTIYLGAGVSLDSGIPAWSALVQAMYFKVMSEEPLEWWRPFPNYLFAISEWQLQHSQEPPEITARKIRAFFREDARAFQAVLRETLYEGFRQGEEDQFALPSPADLRNGNRTLGAVARLCEANFASGVRAVVTYNYDALLEHALGREACQPIWNSRKPPSQEKLPIYHVHGYLPLAKGGGSRIDDIVFTEDQYNRVANDPYSWSNLVQINCMSSSTGLMIGLSLTDRNMRRILDAIRRTPISATQYALLKRMDGPGPSAEEQYRIQDKALEYYERFARSGNKRPPGRKGDAWRDEITGILQAVQHRADEQQVAILKELGIEPIWFNAYSEIPDIVREICR